CSARPVGRTFVVEWMHQRQEQGRHPLVSSGSEAAADFRDGANDRPSANRKGMKAMAGSLDADAGREHARVSLSPSCSWLSPRPRNHERPKKCSISIVLSSTGEGASSS